MISGRHGARTRGPPEPHNSTGKPTSSVLQGVGVAHVSAFTLQRLWHSLGQKPVTLESIPARASVGYSASAGIAGDSVTETDSSQRKPLRGKVTIKYEDTSDDVYVPAPPGRSKTLKINVDLLLWRCRQARLRAQMSADEQQRKELLREAEAGLKRCLVLDPADARTYVVLGKILMLQRRFEDARQLYAEGCQNTGNTNPYIWAAWGWLEFKTGNMARARQLFDAATVVDDTHACAWHKWGLLEKHEGNYLKARDLWRKGLDRCRRKPQSQNAYLYNALAVMAAELGNLDDARCWFEEATNTVEGQASVALWQAWAVLEAKQGDARRVRILFRRALQANPKSRYVHLAWAVWELKQRNAGYLDTCMRLLERGIQLNPTDAALYQVLGLVYWKEIRNVRAARQAFQEGAKADPGHIPIWQAWGCMEAALGDMNRARELFQQGVWADPRSRDTVYVLHAWGVLERKEGQYQQARELFKAAIKVDPKAEKVWFTWIDMEEDQGNFGRADDLRIRQAEQQWEFEVPAGFTTRPGSSPDSPAGAIASSSSSLVSFVTDTLSRFFKIRSSAAPAPANKKQQASKAGDVSRSLPDDFENDISLADVSPSVKGQTGSDAAALTLVAAMNGDTTGRQQGLNLFDDMGLQPTLPVPDMQAVNVLNSGGEYNVQGTNVSEPQAPIGDEITAQSSPSRTQSVGVLKKERQRKQNGEIQRPVTTTGSLADSNAEQVLAARPVYVAQPQPDPVHDEQGDGLLSQRLKSLDEGEVSLEVLTSALEATAAGELPHVGTRSQQQQ